MPASGSILLYIAPEQATTNSYQYLFFVNTTFIWSGIPYCILKLLPLEKLFIFSIDFKTVTLQSKSASRTLQKHILYEIYKEVKLHAHTD